ncbi:MAG: VOC family protein [Gammaproteobacteria bacterium]|nr:VOC family protein [Gammaproteobacteria bacterium]
MTRPPRIDRLDHLVLTVSDPEASADFYTRVLGLRRETFAGGRLALCFGRQKINLHPAGREFEPKAARPTPGSADLCFIVEGPLEAALVHVRAEGVAILEGPVPRTGATGPIASFYFRDPDANLVEVASYGAEA